MKHITSSIALALLLAAPAVTAAGQDKDKDKQARQQQENPQQTQQKQQGQEPQAQRQKGMGSQQQMMSPETVMDHAQAAILAIGNAEQALQSGNRDQANTALDKAQGALSALYTQTPGREAVQQLDRAGAQLRQPDARIDFAPIFATLSEVEVYADPSVMQKAREAEKQMKKGDRQAAAEQLKLARERLTMDVALLPVDEAYARVLAAQAALADGDTQLAQQMLGRVPVVMSEIVVRAPLVPVQFHLSAAAQAAQQKNWDRASELISAADTQLDSLRQQLDQRQAKDLQKLSKDVDRLRKRAESKNKPSVQEIRKVAQQSRNVNIG